MSFSYVGVRISAAPPGQEPEHICKLSGMGSPARTRSTKYARSIPSPTRAMTARVSAASIASAHSIQASYCISGHHGRPLDCGPGHTLLSVSATASHNIKAVDRQSRRPRCDGYREALQKSMCVARRSEDDQSRKLRSKNSNWSLEAKRTSTKRVLYGAFPSADTAQLLSAGSVVLELLL